MDISLSLVSNVIAKLEDLSLRVCVLFFWWVEFFVSHLAYSSCVRDSLDLGDTWMLVVEMGCVFWSYLSLS